MLKVAGYLSTAIFYLCVISGFLGVIAHEGLTLYIAVHWWGIVGALLALCLPGVFNVALFCVAWYNFGTILNIYTFSFFWMFSFLFAFLFTGLSVMIEDKQKIKGIAKE